LLDMSELFVYPVFLYRGIATDINVNDENFSIKISLVLKKSIMLFEFS